MEWKQFVFGKLIQYPEGPIVQGFEHECTGKTQSVPVEVTSQLSPSCIGPGISDLTNWELYPWIEKGGLAIECVFISDSPWLILCRARGRTERGEGKVGRWYTQAHYLISKPTDFDPIALCAIFEYAKATPMVERNFDLPCVTTKNFGTQLKEGWISYIAPILRYLLSGIPFAISSSKVSMEELEELAHLLYVSLPRSISWKLTIKLGADVFSEGDAAFGVAHKVMSGPRMIGFSLGDSSHQIRTVEKAQKHPIQTERLIGDRYVDFLYEKASLCTTDQDLQELLCKEFPHMTWDYFPFKTTFTQAGLLLMHDICERDLLKSFDDEQSQLPEVRHFQVYRKEALCAALPHFLSRTASFIAQSIILWPDIWIDISSVKFPSKSLFVLGEPWTMPLIIAHPALPNELLIHVVQVLVVQLDQYDALGFWKEVFEHWEGIPSWFQTVCIQNEYAIFWRMVHWTHINGRLEDLFSCQPISCGKLLMRCVQGKEIHQEEIQEWLSHAKNMEDVSWLCTQLLQRDAHSVCAILSWSEHRLPIHQLFTFLGLKEWEHRASFAEKILQRSDRFSVVSDKILIVESVFDDSCLKDKIMERLSSRLDPVLGCLLWGMPTSGSGYDETFVHSLIQVLLSSRGGDQLLSHLEQNIACSAFVNARELLIRVLVSDSNLDIEEPSINILHQLIHGIQEPSVSNIDESRLRLLLEGMPQRDWGQLKTIQVLRCFIQARQKINEIDIVLLEELLKEDKETWIGLLMSYPYRTEPLWNIVSHFFQPQQPIFLTEPEMVIVQQCSEETKWNLYCSGMIFEDSFSSISHVEEEQLAYGLWVSMHAPESKTQIFLLRRALSVLSKEEFLLLKTKYSKSGFWDTFIRWIQSFQSYHVPESFPSQWALFDFCRSILEHMTQSVRTQVFTSS